MFRAVPIKQYKGSGILSRVSRIHLLLLGAGVGALLTLVSTYYVRGYHSILAVNYAGRRGSPAVVALRRNDIAAGDSRLNSARQEQAALQDATKAGFRDFLEALAWKLDNSSAVSDLVRGKLGELGHSDPKGLMERATGRLQHAIKTPQPVPSQVDEAGRVKARFRQFLQHLMQKIDDPVLTKALVKKQFIKLGHGDPDHSGEEVHGSHTPLGRGKNPAEVHLVEDGKYQHLSAEWEIMPDLHETLEPLGPHTQHFPAIAELHTMPAPPDTKNAQPRSSKLVPEAATEDKIKQYCRNLTEYQVLRRDPNTSRTAQLEYNTCAEAASHPEPTETPQGKKGIVLCIYNKIMSLGLSLIKELRCHGTVMPIEVHHCTGAEMSGENKAALESEPGVTVVDTCEGFSHEDAQGYKSYWLKPLALIQSKFDQVMLMDADDVFMRDPSYLWDDDGYRRTGTLLFYDRNNPTQQFLSKEVRIRKRGVDGTKIVCTLARFEEVLMTFPISQLTEPVFNGCRPQPLEGQDYLPSPQLQHSLLWKNVDAHHQDSSLVLWDKARHPRALQALRILLGKKWREMEWTWGDKESFWMSLELAGDDYHMTPWKAATINVPEDLVQHPDFYCGSLAQYAPGKDAPAELLYVNARVAIYAGLPAKYKTEATYNFHNEKPTHVTSRDIQGRLPGLTSEWGQECLPIGPEPLELPLHFMEMLSRRRLYYNSLLLGTSFGLDHC